MMCDACGYNEAIFSGKAIVVSPDELPRLDHDAVVRIAVERHGSEICLTCAKCILRAALRRLEKS